MKCIIHSNVHFAAQLINVKCRRVLSFAIDFLTQIYPGKLLFLRFTNCRDTISPLPTFSISISGLRPIHVCQVYSYKIDKVINKTSVQVNTAVIINVYKLIKIKKNSRF